MRERDGGFGLIVWGVAIVSFALWLIGVTASIGGGMVYLLLIPAMMGGAYNLMGHRPTVD